MRSVCQIALLLKIALIKSDNFFSLLSPRPPSSSSFLPPSSFTSFLPFLPPPSFSSSFFFLFPSLPFFSFHLFLPPLLFFCRLISKSSSPFYCFSSSYFLTCILSHSFPLVFLSTLDLNE